MWYGMVSNKRPVTVVNIHVGDLLVMAIPADITRVQLSIEKRLGEMKHNAVTVAWCGIVHEWLGFGH